MSEDKTVPIVQDLSDSKPASNQLDKAKDYRLMSWLDNNRDYIRNQKLTLTQVAAEATAKLGFRVTRFNVAGSCRALGIETAIGAKRLKTGDLRKAVADLTAWKAEAEGQIGALLGRCATLELRLANLEISLGVMTGK